jgi:predicted methyltransferase
MASPLAVLGALLLAAAAAEPAPPAPDILAAVASPDRPAADRDRDALRKPAALLALAHVRPGEKIADLMPGGGYFTRLFSKAVGPGGRVYAEVPAELVAVLPKAADEVGIIAMDPRYGNVAVLVQPAAALAPPEPVDLAWTSDNYHDIYGFFGPAAAAAFDGAVFRMLKPGGLFLVVDHRAQPGAAAAPKSLHRIDEATVKAQVLAAGFTLAQESDLLANPADARDGAVFAPAIRGRTDQFVLVFKKPAP